MKIKLNPISHAIKKVLYTGILASIALSGVTLAQEEADKEKLESMTVTGSNIRGVDLEGAHPVTIITRAQLLATGLTDVGDILQRLPSFSGSPLGTRTNNGGNGSVRVDLRGIGSGRTLVLIDGRRTVDGGDFQSIPSAMIERIEILKEGASAIYGADAIAGVVNIITRKDMSGAEIEFSISDSFDTDSNDIKQGSLVFGDSSETGGFVFGLQYEDQAATLQSDTPYAFLQDSIFILDEDLYRENGFSTTADYVVGGGSSRIPCGVFNLASGGPALTVNGPSPGTGDCGAPGRILSPSDFREFAGGFFSAENDLYNYAPINFLQTPFEKTNIFFNGHKDIGSVEIFTNFRYNHRTSKQRLAPIPFDTNGDPGADVFDADGNPAQGISAGNVFNPFGEDVVRVRRRMVETNREFTQDVQQYQFIIGARGQIAESGWDWEASYNLGFRQSVSKSFGQFIGSRLNSALGPSFFNDQGVATCGTPDAVIVGCVPLNLFGGPGTVTPEMINYISATLINNSETQLDVFNANVSGILFDLPAGPVGSAFGIEYRDEGFQFTPDSSRFIGAATGGQVFPTNGSYDVTSLYGEFSVPLLDSETMGELDFNLGARYDDYSSVGSNTTLQGNLVYRPTDSLLIRATYAEVFREPSVGALFGGNFDNFPTATDPCNTNNFPDLPAGQQAVCIAQGVPDGGAIQTDSQLRQLGGGNENLTPEEGETITVGIAWSPDFLDGFTATVDWWRVELDQGFVSISADDVLRNCLLTLDANSSECALVEPRRPSGEVSRVNGTLQNAARIAVKGVDFSSNYVFGTDYGQFNIGFSYTRLIDNQQQDFAGAPNEEFAGRYSGQAFNEDRAKFTAVWNYGDWTVNYGLDYYSGLDVDLSLFDPLDIPLAIQEIGSNSYSDLAVSYAVPWQETTVTLGINNLLDKAPPFIESGFTGSTEPATYRVFGRSWVVRWTTRF